MSKSQDTERIGPLRNTNLSAAWHVSVTNDGGEGKGETDRRE